MKGILNSWIETLITVKLLILSKNRLEYTLITIPEGFLSKLSNLFLKFKWKCKETILVKEILTK